MKKNYNTTITLKELIRNERYISPKQYGIYMIKKMKSKKKKNKK